ncbi:MAG: ATP-binding cassette domain-containing protein [Streptobacillus sp.]
MISYSFSLTHSLRHKLITLITSIPYTQLCEDKEKIDTFFRKDTEIISKATSMSIQFVSSLVVVLGTLGYLFYISRLIFTYIVFISIISSLIFAFFSNRYKKYLELGRIEEDGLFHQVEQITNGFKEVKINTQIGKNIIYGPFKKFSKRYIEYSAKGYNGYFLCNFIIQFIIYSSIVSLLALGKEYFQIPSSLLVNSMMIILFFVGPLTSIINILPFLAESSVSYSRIKEFIYSLQATLSAPKEYPCSRITSFNEIYFHNLKYSYDLFKVGPLDLKITQGKIHFICGSNGAGKTTLLYLILGLIKKESGIVYVNGLRIHHPLTNLFTVVFSDFYLFDKFYIIEKVDIIRIKKYIYLFELKDKVSIIDNSFSTQKLSYGQKKRLALICALMSDRKILVLDEWAADQDPFFRKKFYEQILPILKEDGYTIIAVTHDDKYFKYADSLLYMETGNLIQKK